MVVLLFILIGTNESAVQVSRNTNSCQARIGIGSQRESKDTEKFAGQHIRVVGTWRD